MNQTRKFGNEYQEKTEIHLSVIDRCILRWGVFGKSFNEVGNAITNKLIDFNDKFERTGKLADS